MSDLAGAKNKPKEMRHGLTTGACAAAAAKAAVLMLVTRTRVAESTIWLPAGWFQTFTIVESELISGAARCATMKDAGDDPDATHLARIVAVAKWTDGSGIELDGGDGVGRVTKPGLPVPIGQAAINPVPRRMIRKEVQEVLKDYGMNRGVKVVISVPGGEEIARKTLNGRLGIVGGISILGTRGTVVPFSTSAYKASIIQALRVAAASGSAHVVLTTGAGSEKYAMEMNPDLSEESFILMGDFAGFSLLHAKRLGISTISLVGMIGKFSKLAQGEMMVHSGGSSVDFGFLARVASEAGASSQLQNEIRGCNTAAQAADLMIEAGLRSFFDRLCQYACRCCLEHIGGGVTVEVALLTRKGELLGREVRRG
ncbi:cobalt-precorrin-5B (C1)-methyltransferase [Paenibacillus forsythiae]|uniref:Cobalt-precorrin-5B C(1)-methyltransferase n=1 Tax=Paenibacillus forsythiae TaxID=365616 RepID=A0ABU3HDN1_9BACL|nr:cobalt-precorrin-5B (C(1))-methyltransferase [Paenibacillus forsythiae]MDT3428919.1 cobalt-precorrin-5B (C1)-methyltransferase [Paenibacillus forsythiae]